MYDKCIEIGKRIKQRREELKITQEELGNLLWLNKSTIQRYEAGQIKRIKIPVLHAMAKQLDVNPEWLALKTDDIGTFSERPELFDNQAITNTDINQEETISDELVILNRKAKKLSPEKQKKLLDMARLMFKEEFDD